MKRCKIVFAALACCAVIALFAAAGCSRFSTEPVLTVHLRCDAEASGTLSAALISPNGLPENLKLLTSKPSVKPEKSNLPITGERKMCGLHLSAALKNPICRPNTEALSKAIKTDFICS